MNDQQLEARITRLLRRRAEEASESFDADVVAASAIRGAAQASRRRWRQVIATAALAASLALAVPLVVREAVGDTPAATPAATPLASGAPSASPSALPAPVMGNGFPRPFTYQLPADPVMNSWVRGPMWAFYVGDSAGPDSNGYEAWDASSGELIPAARGVVVAALDSPRTHECPPPESEGLNRVRVRDDPAGFLEDLQAINGTVISEVTQSSVDGRPALATSVPGTPPGGDCARDFHLGGDGGGSPWVALALPSDLLVFDVDGMTMVVQVWATSDEGLAAWRPTATAFVDSIHFSQPSSSPSSSNALLNSGDTVRFVAADADGPWADVTVTRTEDYENPEPGSDDAARYIEFEITFNISRDRTRQASWAAQPDWTIFGESGGGIEKIRGIGWGEQSGPPMRHGPTLERPIDARGGDTVHGFIRAPISGSFQTTWLSFTPRSETTDPVDPEWPDDYSWIIDGGPEQ